MSASVLALSMISRRQTARPASFNCNTEGLGADESADQDGVGRQLGQFLDRAECTEFPLLRNRGLEPLAVTHCLLHSHCQWHGSASGSGGRLFFIAGDWQDFRLLRQRTIHLQVDAQSVIMLLSPHAIRNQK